MSRSEYFVPSRADGRSDQKIIYDLVQASEPDTLFPYETLQKALQVGTERAITRAVIGSAARNTARLLERERQRTLTVVANKGYRVARANEHLGLALTRKDRAESMIGRGVTLLKQTRIDELPEPQRRIHEAQLMIMGGLYEAVRTTRRRQDEQDAVIRQLAQRVNKLEGQV